MSMQGSVNQKKMTRKRKLIVGVTLGAACGLILVGAIWNSAHRYDLMEKTTLVCPVTSWQTYSFPNQNTRGPFYRWISNHELAFLKPLGTESGFFVYDTQSHAESFLPDPLHPISIRQTAQLRRIPEYLHLRAAVGHLPRPSPDGQWLLWTQYSGNNNYRLTVAKRDGSCVRTWPDVPNDNVFWLADSSGFVLQDALVQPRLFLYTPESALRRKILTTPPLNSVKTSWSYSRFQCATPNRHALAVEAYVPVGQAATPGKVSWVDSALEEYDLATGALVQRTTIVHPEAVGGSLFPFLSPNGNRIVWCYIAAETPPVLAWLHAHVPAIPARANRFFTLRTSHLDGSGLREIGRIPIPPAASAGTGPGATPDQFPLISPQWTQDGKQLSFIYKNALYTVPIE